MKSESKLMRVLGRIQDICGWVLTVSMAILAIVLMFFLPLRAVLFGLIAIGVCPRVNLPDTVRVVVAIVALIGLSV
jgi:hypothetical protein